MNYYERRAVGHAPLDPPMFTDEQRAWLAEMLTPYCCHITGEHDPGHFSEKRYICLDQMCAAYLRLRLALKMGKPSVDEAKPHPQCHWCEARSSG